MEALPEPPVARVHAQLNASLRILDEYDANIGKIYLPRVPEPHGQQVVLHVQAVHSLVPPRQAYEVGNQEDEGTPLNPVEGGLQQLCQVRHCSTGRRLLPMDLFDQPEHLVAAHPGWNQELDVVVIEYGANAVAVASKQERQEPYEIDQYGLFAPLQGSEGHRRAEIKQEPRHNLPVFGVLANVRLVHSRRHVPVDAADVVRRLVLPKFGKIQTRAHEQRAIISVEHPVEPAQQLPFQAMQQPLGILQIILYGGRLRIHVSGPRASEQPPSASPVCRRSRRCPTGLRRKARAGAA